MVKVALPKTLSQEVKGKLKTCKILSVHIPGTGGSATDNFPTRFALDQLRHQHDIPLIELEGAGSGINAPNIAYRQKRSVGGWFSGSLVSSSQSDAEETNHFIGNLASQTDTGALGAGFLQGAGEHENNELILNLLEELKKEGKLPEEMVLSGHSRGAINAIYLANEIYARYGNTIKLHLVLTDPVPGPFHEMEWKKRVIPPSVKTFTAFYAEDHENLFFIPHDLSRLTFCSPDTIVTTYSTHDDHITITGNSKVFGACYDAVAGIYGFDDNSDTNFKFKRLKQKDEFIYNEYKNKTSKEIEQEFEEQYLTDTHIKEYVKKNEANLIKEYIEEQVSDTNFSKLPHEKQLKQAKQNIPYCKLSEEKKEAKAREEISEAIKNEVSKIGRILNNYPPRPTVAMHSKGVFARKNCQYAAKTSLQQLEGQISRLEQQVERSEDEEKELARLQNLKTNIEKVRRDFDNHPEVELAPPHQLQSVPDDLNEDKEDNEKQKQAKINKRLSYLHDAHHKGSGKYNITSNEFAAYLLILPTLGLSATIFKTMENYDHKFGMLLLGVLTLNLATAIALAAQTTYKLGYNLAHGGFFKPGFTPKEIVPSKGVSIEQNNVEGIDSAEDSQNLLKQ